MKNLLLFIILVCFCANLLSQSNLEYYVSPDGSDLNSGTSEETPFQTFEKVLEVVAAIPRPWTSSVIVNVMPGDYYLDKTIRLTSQHSGEGDYKLVFRNYGALASPVLLGGKKVNPLQWTLHHEGIYYQDLAGVERIDIIYENRLKARKARFPNHEFLPDFPVSDGAYFISGQVGTTESYITAQSQDLNMEQLTGLNKDIQAGAEAYLVAWGYGSADWHKWVYPITHTVPESGRIYVAEQNPTFHKSGDATGNRYYIEGGLRYLDAAGEFTFDATQNRLYYKPIGSISGEIIYSNMKNILAVDGASNIILEGLQFACSGVLPYTDSAYTWNDPDAAVSLNNASFIEIRKCHFKSTGQSAINLESSHQNLIENCLMQYMGQSGIKLYQSDGNTIHNCLIHNIGLRRVYCEGVAIHLSKNNDISHLEIYNSARYGVTVRGRVIESTGADGRPTQNNIVEYVRMYDVNQDSGDTAGLHMAKINTNSGGDFVNYFNQITITRSIAQPNITDEWKPTGVYLDHKQQVMNQSMRNILVRDYDPRYPGYVASRFNDLYGSEDRTSDKQRQIMQNRPWNNESSTKFNCSWQENFDHVHMEFSKIGLTDGFPVQYAQYAVNNEAPFFTDEPFNSAYAMLNEPFSISIAGSAVDPNGDAMTYAKVSGPAWLTIAADGTLSGIPSSADVLGSNAFTISVSDGVNPVVETVFAIHVFDSLPTIAYWNERGTNSAVIPDLVGDDHSLSGASGIGASAVTVAPNPTPNPDPATDGATGSIFFSTATAAPATSNATPFKLTSSTSFTFEGWLLHDVNDGAQSGLEYIGGDRHNDGFNNYRGWHLVLANGRLQIYAEGTVITGTTSIDDGAPHHFAVVWDHASNGGEFRLYIDGVLEGTERAQPVSYTQSHFALGGRATGTDSLYNDNILQGRLDEIRFGAAALLPSQFLMATQNTYARWIDSFEIPADDKGFGDDPDSDGMINGIEAFFGTDPDKSNSGPISGIRFQDNVISFQHPNPDTAVIGVTGYYQWSVDLNTWYSADGLDSNGNTTITATTIKDSPEKSTTTVVFAIGGAVPEKLFQRVEVALNVDY